MTGRFAIAALLAAMGTPIAAVAQPPPSPWVFERAGPDADAAAPPCYLGLARPEGDPGMVVLFGFGAERGGALSLVVGPTAQPVPGGVPLPLEWSGPGGTMRGEARRFAVNNVLVPLNAQTDPERAALGNLMPRLGAVSGESRLRVTVDGERPLVDVRMPTVGPDAARAFFACLRDPSSFPPGATVREGGGAN